MRLVDIYYYFEGNFRYWLYTSRYFKFLLPRHIIDQYRWRLNIMDKECLDNGSCVICGCETPALQMAGKACDKPCYPVMYKRGVWRECKDILMKIHDSDKDYFNRFLERYKKKE